MAVNGWNKIPVFSTSILSGYYYWIAIQVEGSQISHLNTGDQYAYVIQSYGNFPLTGWSGLGSGNSSTAFTDNCP